MKALASAGDDKVDISPISAPPMNALRPSPVRMTQVRFAFCVERFCMVFTICSRRYVFRLLSLVGREIVTVATVP